MTHERNGTGHVKNQLEPRPARGLDQRLAHKA
jgi:hypothetical protein